MFEQTFLSELKTARKPYSMVLSLIIQIAVIGVLCLVPIVFTQVLPSMQLKSVLAAPPKPPAALKMKVSAVRLSTSAAKILWFSKLPLRVVQPARSNATDMEAPPNIETGSPDGQGIPGGVIGSASSPVEPPPVPEKPKPQQQKAIRVGTIASANLIRMVQPAYPALARASRVQGTVEFTATISKEGAIENLLLRHGHPLLVNAAKEAVLQWRYRPTLLNGEPVEVITDIVVNFTLNQ